jgi:hypothetical protein
MYLVKVDRSEIFLCPSHGPFLCEVAKNHSALFPQSVLSEYRFIKFSCFCNEILSHQKTNIFLTIPALSHTYGGHAVVVKALCYRPEGRGFETQRGEWIFSIYLILPATLGPRVHSDSETSTRSRKIALLGSKARSVHRADNLSVICEPIV